MAVVEDCMVRPIGAFELVQALGDQKATDAVACHERELALKEVEAAERRERIRSSLCRRRSVSRLSVSRLPI
jgi:hypothetical protein